MSVEIKRSGNRSVGSNPTFAAKKRSYGIALYKLNEFALADGKFAIISYQLVLFVTKKMFRLNGLNLVCLISKWHESPSRTHKTKRRITIELIYSPSELAWPGRVIGRE